MADAFYVYLDTAGRHVQQRRKRPAARRDVLDSLYLKTNSLKAIVRSRDLLERSQQLTDSSALILRSVRFR
jgi:hypothetical protein